MAKSTVVTSEKIRIRLKKLILALVKYKLNCVKF